MIAVKDVPFVGYPVTDKQRARDFYEGLLGLEPGMDVAFPDGYWIEYEIGKNTLAISDYWKPAAATAMGPIAALEVADFDATVDRLKSNGVTVIEGPYEASGCFMVMVADPDGNSLWIHRRKPVGAGPHRIDGIPFVCYPVADRERARAYYEGTFGLEFDDGFISSEGFWCEAEAGALAFALCSFWKPSAEDSMSPAIAFEIENFDAAVSELKAAGTQFSMEPLETPICHVAVIIDPDGNSVFIHQRKAT
jgi:predicted enzyme related to lactoylglutathione lyase